MQNCHIPIYLAYAMTAYVMASIFYLLKTKNIGTPFLDSLTPKQVEIKKKASYERKKIFCTGILVSCIILFFYRPYNICMQN